MARCGWAEGNDRLRLYHDTEWGMPVYDDDRMYEFLFLEAMQCGLNWNMMLEKREIFRACFAGFHIETVAGFTDDDVTRIMAYPGMIRSERKIRAEIHNARMAQHLIEEFGSLHAYFFSFTEGKTYVYQSHAWAMPAKNSLSETVAADLKKRGFKYLGAVTVYSHLQSCGVINDHAPDCPCYHTVNAAAKEVMYIQQDCGNA